MTEPFDLERLRDIPDPFSGDPGASVRAASAAGAANRPVPAARVQGEPSPTRRAVRFARAGLLLAAIAYEAAWIVDLRAHVVPKAPWALTVGVALPLAAGTAGALAALRPGDRGMGEPARRLAWWALAGPAALAAIVFAASPADAVDGAFWRHAVGCMGTGVALLAGPLALAGLAFRRAFASVSPWRTALLAGACGGLAMATLGILCPLQSGGHLVAGHWAAIVLATTAGALIGRRVALA